MIELYMLILFRKGAYSPFRLVLCAAALLLALTGCAPTTQSYAPMETDAAVPIPIELAAVPAVSPPPAPSPTQQPEWSGPDILRYVFLFIGDGMGPNQVLCVNEALAAQGREPLSFTRFPVAGSARTNNSKGGTTDSAAAATAIATGNKTENGRLGQTPGGTRVSSLGEDLQDIGWKIGILTTVSLDNATPAGFYAHTGSRKNYADIQRDLFLSGFDYFSAGGLHNGVDIPTLASASGYAYAVGEAQADAAPQDSKLLNVGDQLTSDQGLRLAADSGGGRLELLKRNVARGILRLSGGPFFMMAEGGRIDLSCHYHDAGSLYFETLDFDAAVQEALAFYEAHPHETLIVVTADHETGDLSLSPGDRSALVRQTVSCDSFDEVSVSIFRSLSTPFADALPEIAQAFGLNDLTEEETAYLKEAYTHTIKGDLSGAEAEKRYGTYEPVTSAAANLVAKRAGLSFGSGGHTGVNVSVYAVGVGQEAFSGEYENTAIHDKIMELATSCGVPTPR